jgi:hypothetical protein
MVTRKPANKKAATPTTLQAVSQATKFDPMQRIRKMSERTYTQSQWHDQKQMISRHDASESE